MAFVVLVEHEVGEALHGPVPHARYSQLVSKSGGARLWMACNMAKGLFQRSNKGQGDILRALADVVVDRLFDIAYS